jgi:DNA mismatch repair protein MutS
MQRSAATLPTPPVGAAEHVKSPDLALLPPPATDDDAPSAPEAEPAASAPTATPPRTRSAIPAVDTPVMRQYLEIKERYPDCIVFFRLGDFYEMFFDDAVVASQLLDLTLTARDKQKEVPVPMAGVPHHAAKHYIGKLLAHGKKVAICDQVEDARKTKKIVRRAVTQVITPGVVLEEEQLEPKAGHYLAALAPGAPSAGGAAMWGVAYLDASTGEFAATELTEAEAIEELARVEPAELLLVELSTVLAPVSPGAQLSAVLQRRLRIPVGVARPAAAAVDRALLAELLAAEPPGRSPSRDPQASQEPSPDAWPQALAAAAACVRYARATQPIGGLPLFRLRLYRPTDSLVIDESTKTNLELLQTLMERKRHGSLLGVIDQTRTAMGGRLLRRWLLQPLQQLPAIRHRHDAVEWLVERQTTRKQLRESLSEIHDLERLTGRVATQVAVPRDLSCLQRSLAQLPALAAALRAAASEQSPPLPGQAPDLPELLELGEDLGGDVEARIAAAIADSPPTMWREGGFIRRGYNAALDELVELSQGGKAHILRIEERERDRTGIASLKVRYNKVFGYYIEITRSNLGRVPGDYIRKQTTANAERYVTTELAEYESKVLNAEERRIELEIELFEKLRTELSGCTSRLLALAQRVAQLDALAGLAELAHRQGYVRPEMSTELHLELEDGRHPVVEQLAERGRFVPNDTRLDPDSEQILLLTGPNMAGKSTVMRQVALTCILAQLGSFVPARRARLGIIDRVCTRVGASDNLSRGESTFMVEMRETSQILQRATRRSLVILDEIGRGTSTYDGVSIAWAVAEYLHDVIGCKTLFATHYHELCALAAARPRVRNFSVAVRQWQDEIVFLHKLVPGGANRSYGIEVARLAGLPRSVLGRAREILAALETASSQEDSIALPVHGVPPLNSGQLALFLGSEVGRPPASPTERPARATRTAAAPARPPAEEGVLQKLRGLDCDNLTPRAALELLAELTARLHKA